MEMTAVWYEQKSVLRNLLELYQYETSLYEEDGDVDVNEHGLFDYRYLDHYWTEEGRFPFFIKVDGKLAGFALVRQLESNSEEVAANNSIAEFFIMRKYQRLGLGQQAAFQIFDSFSGKWSVSWLRANTSAREFWMQTIRKYTDGNCWESPYNGNPALEFFS